MPQLAEPLPDLGAPESAPNRIRWTRRQCDAIRESGVLNGRYELIDGEIVSKMGQNPPHRVAIVLLNAWLVEAFGAMFVQTQSAIDVGSADAEHNEPEPDAAVTRQPNTAYTDRHPGPADLVLVVEVSDTTLRFDRATKALLYAQAGIQEYWVLDLIARRLLVHRDPSPEGYRQAVAYAPHESVAPLSLPGAAVTVERLLPPASQ